MNIIDYVTGPNGGIMAICLFVGAMAGWGFAQRTTVKTARDTIAELKGEVQKLREQVQELQNEVKDEIRARVEREHREQLDRSGLPGH